MVHTNISNIFSRFQSTTNKADFTWNVELVKMVEQQ